MRQRRHGGVYSWDIILIGDVWLVIRREKGYVFTIVAGELVSDTTTGPNSPQSAASPPSPPPPAGVFTSKATISVKIILLSLRWSEI